MDAFLPGVAGWEAIYNHPHLWHFRFNARARSIGEGSRADVFRDLWNDFAADKTHSIPEADRVAYAKAYARPGRMRAGWRISFVSRRRRKDFEDLSRPNYHAGPFHGRREGKRNGAGEQAKIVAADAEVVVLENTGHWMMRKTRSRRWTWLTKFL